MKSSALAHPNIALIKYWGRRLDTPSYLNIPTNDSISMTKDSIPNPKSNFELLTHTTIEFSENYSEDSGYLKVNDSLVPFNEIQMKRILKVVNPLRKLKNISQNFKMVSENKFPTAAGLASSSSAFAAVTTCTADALGLNLSKKELSKYARLGSGSATRSIHSGFVCWHAGDSHDTSYAEQICESNEFDIAAIIAIIDRGKKEVASDIAINSAHTSIFNPAKIKASKRQAIEIVKAIKDDDFSTVGRISEKNCLFMHSVMMTSDPALFYWKPNTLKVMKVVLNERKKFLKTYQIIKEGLDQKENEGIECYFTVDAGPNIHCLCRSEDLNAVENMLHKIGIPESDTVSVKPSSEGSKKVNKHLF
jgi:diphosphomevalonate decarboxylase